MHDFILSFEKGYDQDVGEDGNLLSVGQKQLISIARAILANPDIFVMDEATSSVDTLTEALIQRHAAPDARSHQFHHRAPAYHQNADRIFVINRGQIEEEGSHQALLRQRGRYYQLYPAIPPPA